MIPIQHAVLLAFASCVLLSSLPAGAGDTRQRHGAWTASCAANAYCTASTRLAGRKELPYSYQLRISRFQSGRQEIAFLPAAAQPAPGAPITVTVDARSGIQLESETGYRRIGSSNTFVLDQDASDGILRAMRKGRRVKFTYPSAEGEHTEVDFSLNGFAQALTVAGIQPAPAASAPAPQAQTPAPQVHSPVTQKGAGATLAAEPQPPAQPAPLQTKPAPEVPREPERAASPTLPGPSLEGMHTVAQSTPPSAAVAGRKRTKAVQQFACRGNEPAWSLVIDHDAARYLALVTGEPESIALKGKLRVSGEGRTPDVDWRGKAPDGSAYRVLIQEQACVDTMADASTGEGEPRFAYRARLTLPGGKVVQGCCNAGLETVQRAAPAPVSLEDAPVANLFSKQPDDWSRFLLELMPAIDACLEKTPGGAPYVTKAWPMNRGMVGVRTRNAVAGWFDCTAQYDGATIERFDAVTADAGPLPGEGYVVYTPRAHAPLAGNCWRHERVVDLSGNPLGWLSTNAC